MTSVAGAHFSLYTKEKEPMSHDLVKEFNDLFQVKTRDFGTARVREAKLRFGLIKEEFGELLDAVEAVDIVEVADALGDIEYVTWGAIQVFGYSSIVSEKIVKLQAQLEADLETADLTTNPLLTAEGQKEILDELRLYILTDNSDYLSSSLITVLYLVKLAAAHFRVELDAVVAAIHTSNMTKLDEDGKPIFRPEDGKVQKGPNYQTPTADIEFILFGEAFAHASE